MEARDSQIMDTITLEIPRSDKTVLSAITHDLIMVTDNVKHLGKISGIQLENWIERE